MMEQKSRKVLGLTMENLKEIAKKLEERRSKIKLILNLWQVRKFKNIREKQRLKKQEIGPTAF